MSARKELLENIRHYPGDEGADENNARKTMNSIQKRVSSKKKDHFGSIKAFCIQLRCCGVDQYQDWFNAKVWTGQPYVPDSCCIEETNGCGKQIAANETYGLIYLDVCLQAVAFNRFNCVLISGVFQYDSNGDQSKFDDRGNFSVYSCFRRSKL